MVARSPDSTTVLHVDDDAAFADLVADALERVDETIEITTATSAADGLAALEAHSVDCIVSDYQMPEMDGLAFLSAVREDHPELPFILFTGQGSEQVASEAISAGVTEYLQKGGGTDQYTVLANRIDNAVARYRAERQADQAYHALETAREGISLLDEDGYFTYVNDEYCATVGYTRDELLGAHWELLYPEEDVERVRAELLPSIPTEGRWTGQTTYVRKDGTRILVDHALSVCRQGTLICLIKQMSDGPDDRQHAGPLVAEDAFVECVLDALDDVFYVLDTTGSIVRVNERAVAATGYSRAELTRMHATDLFAEADQPAVETALSEAFETGQTTTEVELVTAAGDTCPYEFRTRRLTDVDGEAVGLVGVGRDVSATKRHQRRLERQATQFESFGSVLGHDLATPLNTLSGRLELAREVTTGGEQHFAAAARALERIETLIDDLATAMQQGQLVDDPESVALAATVRSCWALLDTETKAATLRIVDSDSMYADEEAVLRLIENLLHNAVDHAGSDVTVRVGTTPDGFNVAYDGPGIPPDKRADVLEPGYTTTDDGTGFGLVSVDHVAMAHGWALEITDSWADGARFEFTDVEWA